MNRQIKWNHSNETFEHNESRGEQFARSNVPNFFRHPHGKRESYSFYRGFVIARHTVQFTGCRPERRTVLYIITENDTMHITSDVSGVRGAQKVADQVLKYGRLDAGDGIDGDLERTGEALVNGQTIKATHIGGYTVTGHDWYATVGEALASLFPDEKKSRVKIEL